MSYQGDLAPGATLWFAFTSRRFTTGVPFALASGALAVYQDASDTQSTAGVTLTASFDGVTGQNRVTIDTSADGTFYAVGHDYSVILSAGTVDSVSVVGEVLATFSMGHRSSLRPTTAGRTLDVSASGEAGVDWANVGSPTTTLALTGTTISTSQVAASVTGAVGSVTGAVGSVTGNVGGNVVGSVASVTAGVSLAAGAVQAIWNALTSALTTVGSVGKLLVDNVNATIGSRLPTASYVVPLDAAGVRAAVGLASANLDTQLAALAAFVDSEVAAILATVDTEVGAIKAQTDQFVFTTPGLVDAAAAPGAPDPDILAIKLQTDQFVFTTPGLVDASTAAPTPDPDIAAIKAQTDQLTFTLLGKVDASLQAAADLATAVGQKVADMILRRAAANIEDSAFGDTLHESSLYGLLRRASDSDTTTLPGYHTVRKADGTTLAQIAITTSAEAEGITAIGV